MVEKLVFKLQKKEGLKNCQKSSWLKSLEKVGQNIVKSLVGYLFELLEKWDKNCQKD